jgi:hypothetical protein
VSIALGGLTAAAVIALSVVNGSTSLGTPAFAVTELPQGEVAITVVSTAATATQMTAQLHAEGVNVTIETMPASPQLVGTWVAQSYSGGVPLSVSQSIDEQTHGYVATLELPTQSAGAITLYVGRTPDAGEQVQVGGVRNALAPGGLLACLQLSGSQPATASQVLSSAGYSIRWAYGNRLNPVAAPPAGTTVTDAYVSDQQTGETGQRDVTVLVADPDASSYRALLESGFPLTQQSAPPSSGASCAHDAN